MKLTKVTFTGVDERTDLKRLARLQRAFPFAEFGFLISKDWRQNGNRFPNPNIMWNLANQWSQQPFPFPCIYVVNWPWKRQRVTGLMTLFQRQ